jgi:glycosyltransferase involved in cell wall biosynthesis
MGKDQNYIGFFPAGNTSSASSRIRVFSMLPHLDSLNIKYFVNPSLRYFFNLETLFIQKKVSQNTIIKVRLAKILGKKIIYDVDDFGTALFCRASPANVKKMIMLADKITTGSEAQKRILETEYSIKDVCVLPSLIDYYPESPVQNIHTSDDTLRIIWFGVNVNYSTFAKYIEILHRIKSVEIIVVTNSVMNDAIISEYPFIHFKPWSLETFIPILRSCQLSVLTHDGSYYDQAKTNNKMIASITWGVPAVVSSTPEYLSTAQKAGIEYAVFSNTDELVSIIEKLRSPEARQEYLRHAQSLIWQEYSPAVITEKFLSICRETKSQNFLVRTKAILSSYFKR